MRVRPHWMLSSFTHVLSGNHLPNLYGILNIYEKNINIGFADELLLDIRGTQRFFKHILYV